MKRESLSKITKVILTEIEWWVEGASIAFSRGSIGQKLNKMDRSYAEWQISGAMKYASDRGYVNSKNGRIYLTEKGKGWVDNARFKRLEFKPQAGKWDKRWRLIIFDIPESERNTRDMLRDKLFEWDCTKLQNSVFVTPHSCEKELEQLSEILAIENYMHVIFSDDLGALLTGKLIKEYKLKLT